MYFSVPPELETLLNRISLCVPWRIKMNQIVEQPSQRRADRTTFIDKDISSIVTGRTRSIIILSLALVVITLAVYWQVRNHEFINFDDNLYVTENLSVAKGITVRNIIWAFTTVDVTYWMPVTLLSHMMDVQFYGMNPGGHHLTSVFIHTSASVLLFLLLFRLTTKVWRSLFIAALFALHPLHVESVAWVAERKDVLSAFFWFLTLLFYAIYLENRKPTLYLLTLFSFMLGLMSKPMVVTLPVVMLLIDFWPLNRYNLAEQKPGGQLATVLPQMKICLKEKIPFFACSLLFGVITIYAQHKAGAVVNIDKLPIGFRIENALMSYVKYITKTLWPQDLALYYPFPSSVFLWQVIGSLVLLLLVSAATILVGRRYPYLPVGWFWYIITLLPVIGFVQAGMQSMADRFTYIPHIGLFMMVAWGVPDLVKDLPCRQQLLAVLAGVVIITSTVLTWQQLGYWQDTISLTRHTLQVTTDNYIMHYSLGVSLARKGNVDEAIHEYQEAIRINPNNSDVHNNLGVAFDSKGDLDAAIHEYREALRINPDHSNAHTNLGSAFDSKGNLDEAIHEYQEALRINPNNPDAHNNLGVAFARKGNLDEAIHAYQEALRIKPNNSDAHNNLGAAFAGKGNLDEAIKEYQKALALNPKLARNNLESALQLKSRQ